MIELKGQCNKDCIIYTDNVEDDAISMIYNILGTKEMSGSPIRIMPDVHAGKDIVVGFTMPITDYICPAHVGGDIGCTIDTYITSADVNPDDFSLIEYRVKNAIPFGFEINEKRVFEVKDFIKFMKSYFNKARAGWTDMIDDFELSERGISDFCKRVNIDESTFYKSVGSVGGGNHFLEFGATPDNKLTFTIHCGSRNLGQKVCRYWMKIASSSQVDNKKLKEEISKIKKTVKNRTERENLIAKLKSESEKEIAGNGYLTGDNMRGYITDMVFTTGYALYNHKVIADRILEILYKINRAKLVETICSTHNYIDFEDHILRKGAIRSYAGEKMIVPFNMRDGLAVCVGKSNKDWNCSCSHGAGRKMSRTQAKKLLTVDEYKEQMKDVYSTTVNQSTIDESPMAYKDTEEIKSLIGDTCEILYMIKPVINIKSGQNDAEI